MDQQDRERLDAFLDRRGHVIGLMKAVCVHLRLGLESGIVKRTNDLAEDMASLAVAARVFLGGELPPAFEQVSWGLSPDGLLEEVPCQVLFTALSELTQVIQMTRPDDVVVLSPEIRAILTQWGLIEDVLSSGPTELEVSIADGVAETVVLEWQVASAALAGAVTALTVLADEFLASRWAAVPEVWYDVVEAVTCKESVVLSQASSALAVLMEEIRTAALVREAVPA